MYLDLFLILSNPVPSMQTEKGLDWWFSYLANPIICITSNCFSFFLTVPNSRGLTVLNCYKLDYILCYCVSFHLTWINPCPVNEKSYITKYNLKEKLINFYLLRLIII